MDFLTYAGYVAFGILVGFWVRDERMHKILKNQQERGDHWFNKYQALARYGEDYPEDYDFLQDTNVF